MAERWEYMTKFIWASLENAGAREYISKRWPNWNNPAKHTPASMIPELNDWGAQGWELIHMEPIEGVSSDGEIVYAHAGAASRSHYYFCVFKRRLPFEDTPKAADEI